MREAVLDRDESYAIDTLRLFDVIGDSAGLFDRARAAAERVDLVWPAEEIHNVAVAGMGGSGIAGTWCSAHGVNGCGTPRRCCATTTYRGGWARTRWSS